MAVVAAVVELWLQQHPVQLLIAPSTVLAKAP